jgi:hypothetical protein
LVFVMLEPGFGGGWKNPVQGCGGGAGGALLQPAPSAAASPNVRTERIITQRTMVSMIPG